MKNKQLLYYGIIAVIFLIIVIIWTARSSPLDEQTAECIASKSTLYVSATCGHCAQQKQILEPHINKITMVDCTTSSQACTLAEIRAVPTWIIDNQKHEGVQSVEKLKELTNC